MVRLPALLIALGLFAACERSNRNIEVQPPSKKEVKPGSQDGSDDDFSNVFTTGSLKLRITGLPTSASSAPVKISVSGTPINRTLSLVSGQGVTTLTELAPGLLDIDVTSTIGSVTYNGTASIKVLKGMISNGEIQMQASSNPTPTPNPDPQPTPMPQPIPQSGSPSGPSGNIGGGNGGGGISGNNDSSIDIGVDIGNTPKPNQGSTLPSGNNGGGSSNIDIGIDIGGSAPAPNQGTQPAPQQNIWDGRSFQGNSMFSIEPID